MFLRLVLVVTVCSLLAPILGRANADLHPETNPEFLRLPTGEDLRQVVVAKEPLVIATGFGLPFDELARLSYERLKVETQGVPDHLVQWVLMDLDEGRVLQSSASPDRKMFGASVSKIFVAAALLEKQHGRLTPVQIQLMANMLVVSSNKAWLDLQMQIGDGDADRGRTTIHAFTQRLGYENTRGYQGYLGKTPTYDGIHGNEVTAAELARFLHDTYKGKYVGSEVLWKFLHTCRTGEEKARRYLPKELIVGGKTGTYKGTSEDPYTHSKFNPDGTKYRVDVRNHVIVFRYGGREYGLVVLANNGSDDAVALLAGGLFAELRAKLSPVQ